MVSEAGCPLVWGGSGLKPFTPMGVAMLGTGAVLIPGGVLVPAGRYKHGVRAGITRVPLEDVKWQTWGSYLKRE